MAVSLSDYPHLGEKTYQVIKDQIVQGQLVPGEELVVVDLAQRLGVSRTPVKDALNRLSAEGLVTREPRKGFMVSMLNMQEFLELMDARLMVELAAVERGIRLVQDSEIEDMWRIIREMERLLPEGQDAYTEYSKFLDRDSELHLLMVSTARNRRLLEIYKNLNIHNSMVRMHYAAQLKTRRARIALQQHKAIVEAFASRDLDALRSGISENILGFVKAFETLGEPMVSLKQMA